MDLAKLTHQLETLADATIAGHSARFFKSGPGEYGEGDRFRGIRVPVLRDLARQARTLPHADVIALLQSSWHEDRLLALFIWVLQARRGDATLRQAIFDAYLAHRDRVNNWDLVDSSAGHLVGAQLFAQGITHESPLLTELAHSAALWDRRIAIMATSHFIGQGHYAETLRLADLLLHDREDLIHKAVGWMLREVGKRDPALAESFLAPRYREMPRTMLRYAIERYPDARRQAYLRGEV